MNLKRTNTEWYNFNQTGGPYNGKAAGDPAGRTAAQSRRLLHQPVGYRRRRRSWRTGWNDDLFPVNQSVDYYNKVRAAYPNQPIELFDFDLGHNPRSASTPSASDDAKLTTAQNEWFKYFVKGEGK